VTAELLSIGQLANTTGMSVSAMRYYDQIGLIETATRVGGKRRFNLQTVGRVNFVQRSQDAGFSLDEIGQILDDTAGGWQGLVASKLDELTERRDRLNDTIAMLHEIRDCGCEAVTTCTANTWC